MMRSARTGSKRTGARALDHPFLILAVIAVMALGLRYFLEPRLGSGMLIGILDTVWVVTGFGFRAALSLISSLLPELPDRLGLAMAGLIGLFGHLLADAAWRTLRWMKR